MCFVQRNLDLAKTILVGESQKKTCGKNMTWIATMLDCLGCVSKLLSPHRPPSLFDSTLPFLVQQGAHAPFKNTNKHPWFTTQTWHGQCDDMWHMNQHCHWLIKTCHKNPPWHFKKKTLNFMSARSCQVRVDIQLISWNASHYFQLLDRLTDQSKTKQKQNKIKTKPNKNKTKTKKQRNKNNHLKKS